MTNHLKQTVNGVDWYPFTVDYDTPDGLFRVLIYAVSHEHACIMLHDLKDSGRVSGQLVGAG